MRHLALGGDSGAGLMVEGCEQVNPALALAGFECRPEAEEESAFELVGVEGEGARGGDWGMVMIGWCFWREDL